MKSPLRMLGIFAHPDDESLGMGGTLARYASEGVEVHILTATRGERGRFGDLQEKPSPDVVGRTREMELRLAANVLGARSVRFLDYIDGDLDQTDPAEIIPRIVRVLRKLRPHVVVTFAPDGAYGHPDHIAISQFATAAVVAAADPCFAQDPDQRWRSDGTGSLTGAFHRVQKLYYMAWGQEKWDAYQTALKRLVSRVDGVERQAAPWPEWAITTRIDTAAYWRTAWEAICQHRTQMSIYRNLAALPETVHRKLWGSQEFYRAFSTVNGGRTVEDDLFQGLRERADADALPWQDTAAMAIA